ncbi:uncharacterized protein LOC110715433 [Chenopodium quinoa]|uniref:uncharacterized protein LOC110715433 n=1 Tax=Chenopodium quinoa TaxID=63459 RepID=UPI000B772B02|nr:uncharacterized protein LOC110715433 [Chenopodium quinoa]
MAQHQTPPLDPSQDPTSPYYLHPSDNPGMKLVSDKSDGNAYGDWKRSMLISLSAKNKLGFVDGSISKPDSTSPLLRAWERCNSMIISWMLGVLDQNLARSVFYFSTAREIWQNLEERYGASSGTVLFALEQAITEIKQGTDDVSTFYTKLKRLWDQLDDVDPLPFCHCDNCTCTIAQRLLKSQRDKRLVQFLMKLNDGFEVVRGSILLMQPLPLISYAYRLLMQEEKHRQLYRDSKDNSMRSSEDSMAFATSRQRFQERWNNKPQYNNSQNNFSTQRSSGGSGLLDT